MPAKGSLLGLDVSPRRLGLAGTDAERRLATPLRTMPRRRLASDLAALREIAAARGVVGWVVGWPLNMDGSAGPACDRIRSFVADLIGAWPAPVLLLDERLTTFAAQDAIAEGRFGRLPQGQPGDHIAAAILLEDALRAGRA